VSSDGLRVIHNPVDHQHEEVDPNEFDFVLGQPYVVKWLDSGMHISEGWVPVAEHLKNWKLNNMLVKSAGILVYDDGDVIGLGLSISEANGQDNEMVFGLQLIFKANITEVSLIDVE
jgi:hypothetical protein